MNNFYDTKKLSQLNQSIYLVEYPSCKKSLLYDIDEG